MNICHTKNRMINIPNNFGKKEVCQCGETETMSQIYSWNKKSEQTEILKRVDLNMSRRNEFKIKSEQDWQNERDFPYDQIIDPLHFVQSSIGYG